MRGATPGEIVGLWEIMPGPRRFYKFRYLYIAADGFIGHYSSTESLKSTDKQFIIDQIRNGYSVNTEAHIQNLEPYHIDKDGLMQIVANSKHGDEFFVFEKFLRDTTVSTMQGDVHGLSGDLLMGQVYRSYSGCCPSPLDFDHLHQLID